MYVVIGTNDLDKYVQLSYYQLFLFDNKTIFGFCVGSRLFGVSRKKPNIHEKADLFLYKVKAINKTG